MCCMAQAQRGYRMCLSVVVFCKLMGLCFPFHSILVFPSYFVDDCFSICTAIESNEPVSVITSPTEKVLMQTDILTNKALAGQH